MIYNGIITFIQFTNEFKFRHIDEVD